MRKADFVAHLTTCDLENRLKLAWSREGVWITTTFNGVEYSVLSDNYDAYQRIIRCDEWDLHQVELGYTYRRALLSLYIEAYLAVHSMNENERQ